MTDSASTPRQAADRVALWLDQWRPDRHQTYSLARADLQVLIDNARATTPGETEAGGVDGDLLVAAEAALRTLAKKCLAVKPTLSTSFPDAPDDTPWGRFIEQPCREAYDLAVRIRRSLAATPPAPEGEAVQRGHRWVPDSPDDEGPPEWMCSRAGCAARLTGIADGCVGDLLDAAAPAPASPQAKGAGSPADPEELQQRINDAHRRLAAIALGTGDGTADEQCQAWVGSEHVYLSTGCLHGEHGYCRAMTGQQGKKRPGQCKFCDARCVCPCHSTSDAEDEAAGGGEGL